MIDPNVSAAFARVAARERDVLHAFEPGFEPERADVAGRPGTQPDANPLHVAAPEGTYFIAGAAGTADAAAIAAARGRDAGISFTRAGTFDVASGELRFAGSARPVLGFVLGRPNAVAPLRVDPYDAALGRVSGAHVDADGTFAYTRTTIDPRTGARRAERVAVGRVALAQFPAGTQPERVDATHVRPPAGVTATVGTPADGRFGALVTHARDLGRVDVLAGLERMREAYDDVNAIRAATAARGAVDRTAMDLLK